MSQTFAMNVGPKRNKFQFECDAVNKFYVWPFIKSSLNKTKKFSNEVKITLTERGFQIGHGMKKLLPEYDEIRHNSYQWMVWADNRYIQSPPDGVYCSFSFIPVNKTDHSHGYKIMVERGERNPYLLANRSNPWPWTKLICTSVKRHGTEDETKSVWFFDDPKDFK